MIRFAVFLVVFLLMTPPTKANSASYNDAQTNLIESQIAQLNNNLRANLGGGGKKKVVKKCKVTVKKIKKGKKVKLKRIKKCKKSEGQGWRFTSHSGRGFLPEEFRSQLG